MICKEKRPQRGRLFVVEAVGVVPLAETPRQTIINRLFCLMNLPLSCCSKAKCSLPFAAPTLNSDHNDLYRQIKSLQMGDFYLWWRWSELNRRLTRLPKNFLHT